jgi:putative Holliday junction resolvase
MPECSLAELASALARRTRLLGVDLGDKTIGLALSDTGLVVATPLETLKRGKFTPDADKIAALAAEHGIGGIVYGLPVNMDGSEGPRCQSTRQFARNLDERLPLPYAFQDERLSTAAVERVLIGEADLSRKRRAEVVDKAAAAWILQSALDTLAAQRPGP